MIAVAVEEAVTPGSLLHTDELLSDDRLEKRGYRHRLTLSREIVLPTGAAGRRGRSGSVHLARQARAGWAPEAPAVPHADAPLLLDTCQKRA